MVYVAGSGTTAFGEFFDRSLLSLMQEAVDTALADANSSLDEIEAIYIGNMLSGALQNLQHLGSQLAGKLKVNIPIYLYEAACASGGMAMHHAWKDVDSGLFKKVLVVGAEKMTELPPDIVNQHLIRATSPEEQITGISFCGLYAIMAQKYLHKYNKIIEDLSFGPALMHRQSEKNPHAHFYGKTFSLKQINQARMIAAPLNLLHCSPLSDGASAVILQKEPTQVSIPKSSMATDSPDLAQRSEITSIPATKIALERLNLPQNWQEDCRVIEVHDCFSIALIMALEDLGICNAGTAPEFLENIWNNPDSNTLEINPSGGLKGGGHPVGATGVKQIHSCYQRLKNKDAGSTGLAHNIGGTGGTAILHYLETC